VRRWWKASVVVELLGITATSVGIGVEVAMTADIGFLLITAGSVLIATGSLMFSKIFRGG